MTDDVNLIQRLEFPPMLDAGVSADAELSFVLEKMSLKREAFPTGDVELLDHVAVREDGQPLLVPPWCDNTRHG